MFPYNLGSFFLFPKALFVKKYFTFLPKTFLFFKSPKKFSNLLILPKLSLKVTFFPLKISFEIKNKKFSEIKLLLYLSITCVLLSESICFLFLKKVMFSDLIS